MRRCGDEKKREWFAVDYVGRMANNEKLNLALKEIQWYSLRISTKS